MQNETEQEKNYFAEQKNTAPLATWKTNSLVEGCDVSGDGSAIPECGRFR